MKRILPTALASAALALPILAVTLPLTESFQSGLGDFTVEDTNADGVTIKAVNNYGYNYTNGLTYNGSADNAADDWLFSPVMSLKKGYVYELSYRVKTSGSDKTNRLEVKAGTAAESGAMTVDVSGPKEYPYFNWGTWVLETATLSVPEDGDYYVGLHVISDANQSIFYIDDFSVGEGQNSAAPTVPVTGQATFNVVDDKLQLSFDITLPTQTVGGETLADEDLEIRVSRDDNGATATLTGRPGATVTYTDTEALAETANYSVVCAVGEQESAGAVVEATPVFGDPAKVENFIVKQDGNKFSLTWDAVTEPALEGKIFIPSSVRYLVKCNGEIIELNTPELSAEYTYPAPEEGQESVTFTIVAVASGRTSSVATSSPFMVGNPYKGEFAESFAEGKYRNSTWTVEDGLTKAWAPSTGKTYNPVINPQDEDGGCLVFYYSTSRTVDLMSPMIDLSEVTNPMLRFWVYLYPGSYYEVSAQPGFLTGGEVTLLGDPISIKDGEVEGWKEYVYEIPESALEGTTQLVFRGNGGTWGELYFDNISIRSYLDHDLAVEAAAPKAKFEIGSEVKFAANIVNNGVNDESDFTVSLYADDVKVGTIDGIEVAAMSKAAVEIPFTVLPKYAGKDVGFTIAVDLDSDMNEEDNEVSFSINIPENDLQKVENLKATGDDKQQQVTLEWDLPQISTDPVFTEVFEGFDEWEAGSMTAENGWIFLDVDGQAQNGVNNINSQKMFAAMIATNFTAQYSWLPSLASPSGTQCLAMTELMSAYNTDCDNWVISPEVKGGTTVSFMAFCLAGYGNGESFDIMWTEGGTETADFTLLRTEVAPLTGWQEFSFELPENAVRFAIRVSGRHSYPVMLDSFTFTAKTTPPVLTGFNLYRDHELMATVDAGTDSHIDENPVVGQEHTYHVTALYDKGESGYGEPATALVKEDTGVATIGAGDSDAEYYDLSGIRISRPEKGQTVIVRKGGLSEKVIF